jgi:hypothetical protein
MPCAYEEQVRMTHRETTRPKRSANLSAHAAIKCPHVPKRNKAIAKKLYLPGVSETTGLANVRIDWKPAPNLPSVSVAKTSDHGHVVNWSVVDKTVAVVLQPVNPAALRRLEDTHRTVEILLGAETVERNGSLLFVE